MRLSAMLIWLVVAVFCLAACQPDPGPVSRPDMVDAAAAEATAILRQAQATALVQLNHRLPRS